MTDPERFFTITERRAILKRSKAEKAEVQRNIEDDFWWLPVDLGGDDW